MVVIKVINNSVVKMSSCFKKWFMIIFEWVVLSDKKCNVFCCLLFIVWLLYKNK